MKEKKVTEIFIMILNFKKALWSPWFIQKYFSVVKVKALTAKIIQLEFHSLEVVSRCLATTSSE